jgi:hypothetical protein
MQLQNYIGLVCGFIAFYRLMYGYEFSWVDISVLSLGTILMFV